MPPEPIDTSRLGPIRVDPEADLERSNRARAVLNKHLPTIAGIPALQARTRALAAMLEFEQTERNRP